MADLFTAVDGQCFWWVPPLISLCLSVGFFWFGELEVNDPGLLVQFNMFMSGPIAFLLPIPADPYVFTPRDARWKRELSTFSKLWPLEENKFIPGKSFETKRFVHVLCKAKDGGNILRPDILDEIVLLNKFISENISVPTTDGRFNLSYQDLCLSYDWTCGSNEHIEMFRRMAQVGRVIDLRYPKGGNKDTPAYLGTAIGDIKLNGTDGTVLEAKITQVSQQLFAGNGGQIPSKAPAVFSPRSAVLLSETRAGHCPPIFHRSFFLLIFTHRQHPVEYSSTATIVIELEHGPIEILDHFEYAVERFLLHGFESSLISISFAHYQSLQDGLDENARRFVPNFVISFVLLTLFCICCSFTFLPDNASVPRPAFPIDWVRSKPYVACAGLFNTILALVSSFGFLLLLGIPYNVINTIIPFLIIAVGIDDMFVMNSCWDQSDPVLPPAERMAEMMQNGGVAVSITNITDVLAFLIGCITELPGIELFCLYAFAAVLFCYVYQLTFFAAFMAIMGNVEQQGRHCLLLKRRPFQTRVSDSMAAINPIGGSDGTSQCSGGKNCQHPVQQQQHDEFVQNIRVDGGTPSTQNDHSSTNADDDQTLKDDGDHHLRKKRATDWSEQSERRQTDSQARKTDQNGSNSQKTDQNGSNSQKTDQNGSNSQKTDQNGLNSRRALGSHSVVAASQLHQQHHHPHSSNLSHRFFGRYFGPILLHPVGRALTTFCYVLYLVLAIVGCLNFREGLEPSHLVTDDHYIARYFENMKTFWKMGPQLHIAVLNPPNLTDPIERQKLLKTVETFENTPYTMGREGTVFFFLEFLNYLDQLNAEPENTDRIWHQKLRSWLKNTGASNQWDADIVYRETGAFRAFRFQVAMKNIVEPDQHKLAAKLLREIADRQPFHLEIYHEAFPFADQYLIILPSTYRNVLISLLCMTVIALLLIPSVPSAMLIILSIVSISTGVFGYMTFWGVNLDA
uniref:SSD domain-containing protein n=1 Tax=Globodera rostochiensis TaxID=31243 RepID=A0A914H0X9_GLORO